MSEGQPLPEAPRKSKAKKIFFSLITIIGLGIVAEQIWYHYTFPYGWSHCCDIQLAFALQQYAEDHGGHFPSGADCPEASLSLLYSNYVNANLLRGKIISLKTVEHALAANGKLGPDSCGWHYVEGITLSDDSQIAIVWDKVGLGHNGQRLEHGGHFIIRADGRQDFVSGEGWSNFSQEQQELLAHRNIKAFQGLPELTARIVLPGGKVLTNFDGQYELQESASTATFSLTGGSERGNHLDLKWYRIYPEGDGQMTWSLVLPDEKLRSKPVTFITTNGQAIPDSITFEMERY